MNSPVSSPQGYSPAAITAKIGVLSDSHIPFRLSCLPDQVSAYFSDCDQIIHAGDLEDTSLIAQLGKIAPVHAVAGNIHWQYATGTHDQDLPMSVSIAVGDHLIWVTHGHLNFGYAFYDKVCGLPGFIKSLFRRKKRRTLAPKSYLERVNLRLIARMHRFKPANTSVVVFGHSHKPIGKILEGVLYYNPGSVIGAEGDLTSPSIGRLTFYADGRVEPAWFELDHNKIQFVNAL